MKKKKFEIREGDGNEGCYRRGYVMAADAFKALELAGRRGMICKPRGVTYDQAEGDDEHAILADYTPSRMIFGDCCGWVAESYLVEGE